MFTPLQDCIKLDPPYRVALSYSWDTLETDNTTTCDIHVVINDNHTWYSRGIQMTVICSKVFPVKKKSIPRVRLLDRLTWRILGLENRRQLTYCGYSYVRFAFWRFATWWNAIAPCYPIKVAMGPLLHSLLLPTKEGISINRLLASAVGYSIYIYIWINDKLLLLYHNVMKSNCNMLLYISGHEPLFLSLLLPTK